MNEFYSGSKRRGHDDWLKGGMCVLRLNLRKEKASRRCANDVTREWQSLPCPRRSLHWSDSWSWSGFGFVSILCMRVWALSTASPSNKPPRGWTRSQFEWWCSVAWEDQERRETSKMLPAAWPAVSEWCFWLTSQFASYHISKNNLWNGSLKVKIRDIGGAKVQVGRNKDRNGWMWRILGGMKHDAKSVLIVNV